MDGITGHFDSKGIGQSSYRPARTPPLRGVGARIQPEPPPKKAIVIAWAIEGVCIVIGFLLAVVVGIESADHIRGTTGDKLMGAVMASAPFLAAALAEFCRIPLVETLFSACGKGFKALAVVMIVICACVTTESLLFGFERAFATRLEEVRVKTQDMEMARTSLDSLKGASTKLVESRAELNASQDKLRIDEETLDRRVINDSKLGIDDLATRRAELERQRLTAIDTLGKFPALAEQEKATCLKFPRDRCDSVRTQERLSLEEAKLRGDVADINRQIADLGKAADDLRTKSLAERNAEISKLRSRKTDLADRNDNLNAKDAEYRGKIEDAEQKLATATSDAEAAVRTSQMHRFAKVLLGSDDADAAMTMVTIFSFIIAAVLSLTGSVTATMYYRVKTQPAGWKSYSLLRSIRGWVTRQRKKHSVVQKIEVPVEVPVDREVIKTVEVTKPELILVPVPLDATEEMRRQIMERAARIHTTSDFRTAAE